MAPRSIFRKSLRFSLLFCRNGHPVEGFASHFGRRLISSSEILAGQDDSTVSYLVNSCGLSPESAVLVSHKVKLQSLEKADSVLALLREYEFSETQISTLVRRHPRILWADAKKTLAPKLEFFCSIGMSRLDLAKTVTYSRSILDRSLENHIVPSFNLLKDVVHSDVKVLGILKCSPWIFRQKLSKTMMPNIELLRELGMPQSSIARLITYYVQIVMREPESFSQLVGEVEQLGFDLRKTFFVQAMLALSGKNKTTWKRNEEAYRRWGWSDNDILSAFRLYPLCMTKSEKKIMGTMDFLVNKMGWHSQKIAKCPHVLCFSFEKRIIPRFSVVKVLMLKGLVEEENVSLSTIVAIPENYFLNKFVTTYLRQVPQLLNVYQGKVDVQDV
ncbi:hypothetical protein ABKV19_018529 [Rosa sericea]